METRENLPPVLLPQVSRETIDEIRQEQLLVNQESFVKVGIPEEDTLLKTLSTLPNPFIGVGGQELYLLLSREAQKLGENLPALSPEDIEEYSIDTPIFARDPRSVNREREIPDERTLIEKAKPDLEVKRNYITSRLNKFMPENPFLMKYLKDRYDLYQWVRIRRPDPIMNLAEIDWITGSICTYELLRIKTEKERMKGLNL